MFAPLFTVTFLRAGLQFHAVVTRFAGYAGSRLVRRWLVHVHHCYYLPPAFTCGSRYVHYTAHIRTLLPCRFTQVTYAPTHGSTARLPLRFIFAPVWITHTRTPRFLPHCRCLPVYHLPRLLYGCSRYAHYGTLRAAHGFTTRFTQRAPAAHACAFSRAAVYAHTVVVTFAVYYAVWMRLVRSGWFFRSTRSVVPHAPFTFTTVRSVTLRSAFYTLLPVHAPWLRLRLHRTTRLPFVPRLRLAFAPPAFTVYAGYHTVVVHHLPLPVLVTLYRFPVTAHAFTHPTAPLHCRCLHGWIAYYTVTPVCTGWFAFWFTVCGYARVHGLQFTVLRTVGSPVDSRVAADGYAAFCAHSGYGWLRFPACWFYYVYAHLRFAVAFCGWFARLVWFVGLVLYLGYGSTFTGSGSARYAQFCLTLRFPLPFTTVTFYARRAFADSAVARAIPGYARTAWVRYCAVVCRLRALPHVAVTRLHLHTRFTFTLPHVCAVRIRGYIAVHTRTPTPWFSTRLRSAVLPGSVRFTLHTVQFCVRSLPLVCRLPRHWLPRLRLRFGFYSHYADTLPAVTVYAVYGWFITGSHYTFWLRCGCGLLPVHG